MSPMLIQLLKNGGQGALNGAAGVISQPVNGIADKAKIMGVSPEAIPGSGAWMGKEGITGQANGFGGDMGKMLGGMAVQTLMGQRPNLMNGLLGLGLTYGIGKLMEAKPWRNANE